MNNQSTLFETGLSLVTIHYVDGEYFYTFAESDLKGPYCEEREAYQQSMQEMAGVLAAALSALSDIERCVQEIREPFQDLRRITEG
jgi:hypothetical protein